MDAAKRSIVLSDGTGNAASSVWRTNVWRLFELLDLTGRDQVAKYDDGVGSSGFKPLALLGGAFGWGLKRNVLVRKKLADGSVALYYYHRASGKRLSGEPGSPGFLASFADAEKSILNRRHDRTFDVLIREYTSSPEFRNLAVRTQGEYRRMLKSSESKFGSMPIALLNNPQVRKVFLKWRDGISSESGTREGDNRLSAISAMLSWGAMHHKDLHANHLKGFNRLYHAHRSEIIWLPEHLDAFMKIAPVELRRALILALHTSQRQSDLLRLPWSSYDGTWIKLRPQKSRHGGKPVTIKCPEALRRMLDDIERVSPLILTTKTRQAFKKRYFARLWSESTKKAGLASVTMPGHDEPIELHFHDIRGTTVTSLSMAGCNQQQIATITGHSLKGVHQILDVYLARTQGLAEQAYLNWENSPHTKFANALTAAEG